MVEALIAALAVAVVVTAARRWWRGRGSASTGGVGGGGASGGAGTSGASGGADDGRPEPGSLRRSPTAPGGDRGGTEVTTDHARAMDATEEGNRIWEGAMADWEAGNYEAASDGFGWAETQYSAAADLFERAPSAASAVWQTGDGDEDGARRAAESYETAARHMRLAAERAAEDEFEASTEHVESAREALAGTRGGPAADADGTDGRSG